MLKQSLSAFSQGQLKSDVDPGLEFLALDLMETKRADMKAMI